MAKETTKTAADAKTSAAPADKGADAEKATEAKATETGKAAKPDLVPAIAVSAPAGAFRRCGRAFAKEPTHFEAGYFDDEDLETLRKEPRLHIADVEVDPAKVNVIARPKDEGET